MPRLKGKSITNNFVEFLTLLFKVPPLQRRFYFVGIVSLEFHCFIGFETMKAGMKQSDAGLEIKTKTS